MNVSSYTKLRISAIIQAAIGGCYIILNIIEMKKPKPEFGGVEFFPLTFGLWLFLTGGIALAVRDSRSGQKKPLVCVYLVFSILSLLLAVAMLIWFALIIMVISSSDYMTFGNPPEDIFTVHILIIVLSLLEFVCGIVAATSASAIEPCVREQQMAPPGIRQITNLQEQEATPERHVFLQGSDGRPVAVPVRIVGPMSERCGTTSSDYIIETLV